MGSTWSGGDFEWGAGDYVRGVRFWLSPRVNILNVSELKTGGDFGE